MPSLLFAQAGRTRLQADAGRKRPRPLAAHGRAELPPRRGPEKGRADPTAAARDREGRSRPPRRKRRPTGPERRRKREEAGRRNAEPPIRTGRPNAVASGCRKETAASPCGARPGGASSEARPREGTGGPDSCGPGSRRAKPSAAEKATADRTGATTKTRRGGEAKCRASYSHRPAERGCKRMPEGNGRVPLRRTAGRSSLRGEAPRRDGRTRQLRPGIAKGAAGGEGR